MSWSIQPCRAVFWRHVVPLVAAVLFFCPAVSAQPDTNCGLPDEMMTLVDYLYAASAQETVTQAAVGRDILSKVGEIDMNRVNAKLNSVGLSHRAERLEVLLDEAKEISARGTVSSPYLLKERLKDAKRLNKTVCKLESIKEEKAGKGGGEIGAITVGGTAQLVPENMSTSLRLTLLLVFGGLLVLLLLALNYAYKWIFALIYDRRSCRIGAALECGLDVVDGYVTVLGRKGCRFQPVNQGAFERAAPLIEAPAVFVVVGKQRLLVDQGNTQGYFLGLRFKRPLSKTDHAKLLAQSTVEPRVVPKSRARHRARKAMA